MLVASYVRLTQRKKSPNLLHRKGPVSCTHSLNSYAKYLPHRPNLDIMQSSLEVFFATVCLLNLVVGWGMQRSAARPASRDHGGVPLIHGDDVGPLRVALKRRFPAKKDPQLLAMGDVGEIACGIPVAR